MGSILYLAIGVLFGFAVCETLFPNLREVGAKTFDGKTLSLSSYFIRVPAWVLSGVLPLTWVTYLSAYVIKVVFGTEYPLFAANVFSMFFVGGVTVLLLIKLWDKRKNMGKEVLASRTIIVCEIVFFAVLFLFFTELMFYTFRVSDGTIRIGYSVFSDFAPHMGMIRSFSFGNNFPTEYAHFAGEDIKYHFMFQFLVGNLEFLGMRLDYAFNIPSAFGMLATSALLYALGAKLTGKRLVGGLTVLFFVFRSSPSFFRYVAELPKEELTWKHLAEQSVFLGYTDKENWGLWNINVYCNQRHLAFAIVAMLLAIHFFLPYVYEMAEKLAAKRAMLKEAEAGKEKKAFSERCSSLWNRFICYIKLFFFTKTAFGVKHPVRALFLGLLLGALAFFNGSVLIACCCMLFFMAAVSDHRLDYLITALTALILSTLESKLFITGSAVSLQFFFGFLAENKTLLGMIQYMWQLWGVLLLFIGAYLLLGRGVKRYLVVVFSVPLVLAFSVFLISGIEVTPDNLYLVEYYISVNHKFVMLAELLLSVFPAIIIAELCSKESVLLEQSVLIRRITAVLLTVILTATGVFEYVIVRNQNKGAYEYSVNDPITVWIDENTDSSDVILSPEYSLHATVMGGGMLYYGHAYYAQSAGYDTDARAKTVKQMYRANSPAQLDELVKECGVDFIIVDQTAREELYAREDVIAATYEAVFTTGEDASRFTIYDTGKLLVQ
ncbi:MAG: hypothetical protein IJZ55_11700 [Lachnospiraceae bacterium]|nr:hypothetical protein [Lachnospiraceae bacterium]